MEATAGLVRKAGSHARLVGSSYGRGFGPAVGSVEEARSCPGLARIEGGGGLGAGDCALGTSHHFFVGENPLH